MKTLMFVALGGAVGSAGRYAIGSWMKDLPGIHWGTFFVNITGAFILGLVASLASNHPEWDIAARTGLTVGVLGGFTTFSTWTVESVELVSRGEMALGLTNLFGSLLAGVAAAAAGLALGRLFWTG
ncbi:MAG: CrcB family protein [Acidimicrobiia bacterium]|nr:CrcB family protein [Acidimicrobiia bacterium]